LKFLQGMARILVPKSAFLAIIVGRVLKVENFVMTNFCDFLENRP
jgi:hypothetical protein